MGGPHLHISHSARCKKKVGEAHAAGPRPCRDFVLFASFVVRRRQLSVPGCRFPVERGSLPRCARNDIPGGVAAGQDLAVAPSGWRAYNRVGQSLGRAVILEAYMTFTRITIDPEKMGGVPCIRDLRMPVATVVAMVAEGMTEEEILEAHPSLEQEDIREALRYAAEAVKERALPLTSA